MAVTDQLLLHNSWPIYERSRHFDLGSILNAAVTDVVEPSEVGGLGFQHAGCWECDLANNSLIWSGGVYDIFGLPRGVPVSREEAVAFYFEESRAAMERLRAYAIVHKCGFTLDTEIRPAVGGRRRMRLVAVPVLYDNCVVRLQGLKLII